MSVHHFVLVYDQRLGRLIAPLEEFSDSAVGMQRRFDLERKHRHETTIEVVMLSAESEAQIRRTHARYFESLEELIAGLK